MLGYVRLQTSSLSDNLVITMKCVSGSCHYETCRMYGVVIPLLVDRHTAFAMTTCLYTCHTRLVIANPEKLFPRSLNVSLPRATLVAWWTQSLCKQHLFLDYFATLVMTKNKIATRHKASRHDKLFFCLWRNICSDCSTQ